MPVLKTSSLSIGYIRKNNRNVVQSALSLTLKAGEMVCLIGPNGTGKSTLLRTLAGLQKPLAGKIMIDSHDITAFSAHKKALKIALVLTDRVDVENATVQDIVAFGRHPHSNWWGNDDKTDRKAIEEAIRMVNLQKKANNNFSDIS